MNPAPTPRRTQAERTRKRKKQLIHEAMRCFAQYGYRGAKLSDIAVAAGISEPGLLHHFPSKAHLLMEVLAERDRIDRERFGDSFQGEAGKSLPSLQELVKYNESVPGLVQLFTVLVAESIAEEHPGHGFFLQRYQSLRAQSVEALREGQARGEIRADIAAEDLVVMLFAMMDGLQIQWLFEPQAVDMARIFEQFLKLLQG